MQNKHRPQQENESAMQLRTTKKMNCEAFQKKIGK